MDSHGQRQRVDFKVRGEEMTFADYHIPEICAELVMYGVLIKVDYILDVHTTEIARKEMEAALWQFLQTLQASDGLATSFAKNRKA
jgi:hypothetical protein